MTLTLALYPGMAAAHAGMGTALADRDVARARMAEVQDASGCPVLDLAVSAPAPALLADRNWELAVVATEIAATAGWREQGGRIDGALGFSIGVYAALEAAGVVTVAQIVRMVDIVLDASRRLGGEFGMAAVTGVGRESLQAACRTGGLEIAAELSAAQFLVAGPCRELERVGEPLARRALRWTPLPVRWPLHTSFMRPVAARLDAARSVIGELRPPRLPVYSATTGVRVVGGEGAWELLTGQLWRPQALPVTLRRALADGFARAVELGPGETLRRALRWTCRDRVEVVEAPWQRSEGRA